MWPSRERGPNLGLAAYQLVTSMNQLLIPTEPQSFLWKMGTEAPC